jgi:hypothetical protein
MSSLRKLLVENVWWWVTPIVIVIALVGFIVWRSHAGDSSKDPSTFQYDVY